MREQNFGIGVVFDHNFGIGEVCAQNFDIDEVCAQNFGIGEVRTHNFCPSHTKAKADAERKAKKRNTMQKVKF